MGSKKGSRKTRVMVAVFIFLFSLVPLLCLSVSSPAANVIKIGALYPLSGPTAETASFVVEGIKMAVEEINAKGGVPVQGDRLKIELVFYDTQGNPTLGVGAAEKMINRDKVVAISGDFSSTATLAEREVVNRNKIVMVNAVSVHPKICGPEFPYIFRISNVMEAVSVPFVEYVAKTLKPKMVGLLAVTNDYGRSAVTSNTELYEKYGIKISAVEWMKSGDTDFYTQITKILTTKPDAVYIVTTENAQLVGTLKQLKELGFKGYILGTSSYGRDDIVALAGKELLEGMYLEGPPLDLVMDRPAVQDWWKRYEKRWGRPPMSFSLRGYDTVLLLADAVKRANTLTEKERIREAMAKTNINEVLFGYNGTPNFDKLGQAKQYFGVFQYRNGKRVVIYDEGKKK